jgi:hypothetical protein
MSQLDQNNGYGYLIDPSMSAYQFNWTDSQAVGSWCGAAAAYK